MEMDSLSIFGLVAMMLTLVCYALEERSYHYILGFAIACLLGSTYGFLQGAWPFGAVEVIWAIVAFDKWLKARKRRL